MSEEVIERVDDLIRKNNIKYKDQQSQKAYEQAMRQYQKHNKMELVKQYAGNVKEGNKKAIQKTKAMKKVQKQNHKKKQVSNGLEEVKQQKKVQIPKLKMSQTQLALVNKTIQARADRIIQEQQLSKLNKKLQEQKKRTKLFDLNQKCKKMLSKSHERIVSAKNVPEQRMNVLKNMEERALGQINQLDNIISNIIDQANNTKTKKAERPNTVNVNKYMDKYKEQQNKQDEYRNYLQNGEQQQYYQDQDSSNGCQIDDPNNLGNPLNLNTLLFQKSSEQLLQMDYIPI